jgi:protein-disulfide isomerase
MVFRFRWRVRQTLRVVVTVAGLLAAGLPARGQQAAPQLFVTSAVPDAAGESLTISGGSFSVVGGRFGTRPFVTLDLIPLDVRASTDSAILVAVPVGAMPAGKYLLTVSRGPAPTDNASLEVTLGTASSSQSTVASSPQHNPPSAGATPEAAKALADSLPSSVASTGPAAQVGDHKISIDEVDREWRRSNPSSYLQALRQLYEARREVLNTMVSDELLAREAASRGISVEALLAEEIPKRVIAMPDSAVASLFLSMGDNVRGATLDQMRPALRAWLERHSEPELAKMSYIEELKKVSTRAEIVLDAPRVQVEHTAQDISIGPLTAPVELVAFGDFQSDDYARFAQVFPRIRDTFGDRIRLTFKNLPTLGPQSVAAAEAALCANAQGKFWAYHDALVAPGVVDAARLTESATTAGLNRTTFSGCVDRRQFREVIPKAFDEADRYGIRANPSFLVNGRLAPPPPPFLAPYDYFKLLIEEELGRIASNRAR